MTRIWRFGWAGLLWVSVAASCTSGVRSAGDTPPARVAVVEVPDSSAAVDEPAPATPEAAEEEPASEPPDSEEPGSEEPDSEEPNAIAALAADGGLTISGLLSASGGGIGSGRIARDRDAGVPKVRVAPKIPGGALDPAIVQRVIRRHVSVVRACYEKALAKDPKLSARISPRFVIGVDGRVTSVSLAKASGNAELDSCVRNAVAQMVFPKPNGGVVVVTYPFVFLPGK